MMLSCGIKETILINSIAPTPMRYSTRFTILFVQRHSRPCILFVAKRLKWPDFCSALIVRRLVPLGSHNTRFRSVPVSCSPRTGAAAQNPGLFDKVRRGMAQVRSGGAAHDLAGVSGAALDRGMG